MIMCIWYVYVHVYIHRYIMVYTYTYTYTQLHLHIFAHYHPMTGSSNESQDWRYQWIRFQWLSYTTKLCSHFLFVVVILWVSMSAPALFKEHAHRRHGGRGGNHCSDGAGGAESQDAQEGHCWCGLLDQTFQPLGPLVSPFFWGESTGILYIVRVVYITYIGNLHISRFFVLEVWDYPEIAWQSRERKI